MGDERVYRIVVFDDTDSAIEQWEQVFTAAAIELLFIRNPFLSPVDASAVAEFQPELLVVDLVMGGGRFDGYALLRNLSSNPELAKVPIVVCSKLVTNSLSGQEVRKHLESLPGVRAIIGKLPRYPSFEEIRQFIV